MTTIVVEKIRLPLLAISEAESYSSVRSRPNN